jgi:hypothetical protein
MAVWSTLDFAELTPDRRFDAEFYTHPGFLLCRRFKEVGVPFDEVFRRVVHPGEFARGYQDAPGRLFLRAQNVRPASIMVTEPLYVSEDVYASLPNATAHVNELLLVRTGANHGDLARVPAHLDGVMVSSHTLRLIPKANAPIHSLEILFASETGRALLLSLRSGGTHGQINAQALHTLYLPDLRAIEDQVQSKVSKIEEKREESAKHYADAEAILTAALGLDRVDLTPRLFYEDTYAHAADAGRFDAEYYQPAKWNVLRALAAMPGKPVEEHFRPVKKLWQPSEQPASATVRNYDLTDALTPFLDDTTPTATAGEIKSTKKRFEPGDLVVSRLRSYLKEIAVVLPSDGAPLVGSTEFIVLRSRKTGLSAEALLVFLRSMPIQTVLKWCQDGSNHPRFAEKELLRLPVPDAILKVQDKIASKIKEAIAARQESRRLLDEAKRTVEAAILKGGKA